MNRAFRLIWSAARGACIVAPETARGRASAISVAAIGLCLALVVDSDVRAQSPPATVAPVNGNTAAYTAPNGVPVVNINTANGAGLSRNQYNRYDVDQRGMVLNNSLAPGLSQSQLAGGLAANPNLNAPAKVILNEVVSPNRSALAGYTEVLGSRADVIVANPYGITCTGCGFLNTDRITLTTGTPNFGADGGLAGFSVSRGDVLINGGGLDASAQQVLDIVTRSLRLDGQVNTRADGSLGIFLGNNQWRYASRDMAGATSPDGPAPAYAIDSTALGGLYAGRIRIIATEAGVGVRMAGDAAASVDDFRLDAAGRVQLQGKLSAARNLAVGQTGVTGAGALEVTGASATLSSGGDLSLTSEGGVTLAEGMLRAGANLALGAQSLTDTSASKASRSAAGTVDMRIAGPAYIDGSTWAAGGTLALQAGSLNVGGIGSGFYSGEDVNAATRDMRITTDGDMFLTRARLVSGAGMAWTARGGALTAGSGVDAEAAGNMALAARSALTNEGKLLARGKMTVDATDAGTAMAASNSGLLQAGGTLAMGAAGNPLALSNAAGGRLLADGVAFKGTALDNAGVIQGNKSLTVQASGAVVNRAGGTLLGVEAGRDVTIVGARLDNAGTLQSAGAMTITVAGALGNAGAIETTSVADGGSNGALTVHAGSVTNDGTLASAGAATVTAARLVNSKLLQAQQLTLTVGDALDNKSAASRILSAGELTINGGGTAAMTNAGIVQAGSTLRLGQDDSKLDSLNNAANGELLGATVRFAGRELVNAGLVQGKAATELRATGNLINRATGNIVALDAQADMQLQAAAIANAGNVQSAGALLARATGGIDNRGLLQAAGTLDASAVGSLANTGPDSRMLSTGGDLTLAAATLDNGGQLQAARALSATVSGALTNSGTILNQSADKQMTLAAGALTNSGVVQAAGAAQLTATNGVLRNTGEVEGATTLSLTASGGVENAGSASRLLAAGDMTIMTGADLTNEGRIQSGGVLRVGSPAANVGKLVNRAGAVLLGDSLAIDAAGIANSGSIGAQKKARLAAGSLDNLGSAATIVVGTGDITVAGQLVNEGVIHGTGELVANAGAIANRGTAGMSSAGDLTLTTRSGGIANDGALYAGKTLALSAAGQTIVNNDNASMDANVIQLDAATFVNSGKVEAKQDIAIKTTNRFNNQAVGIIPGITSTVETRPTKVVSQTETPCDLGTFFCINGYTRTTVYEASQVITEGLDAALPQRKGQIIAGGTLDIDYGKTGSNTAALLSAPNLRIHSSNVQPDAFINQDLHLDQYQLAWRWKETYFVPDVVKGTGTFSYAYPASQADYASSNGDSFSIVTSNKGEAQDRAYRLEPSRSTINTSGAGIYATTLNVEGGKLLNLGSPFKPVIDAIGASPLGREAITLQPGANGAAINPATGVTINSVKPAAKPQSFQGLDLTLPANPNGFFVPAKNPAARYLIETNPLFVNGPASATPADPLPVNVPTGSDALAKKLGFDPDVLQKRLGDASYEARLVRDQIVALTGNLFLQEQATEAAQFQTLMQQAATQAAPLGLTFGRGLTPAQIARLEQDLVWMVEEDVGGTPVLVPVVYLARASREAVISGPVIAAENLRIQTAALENRGGAISGGQVDIGTVGDVRNTSGVINGRNVSVASTAGSVLNETYASGEGATWVDNIVGKRAVISGRDALAVAAAKDVAVRGATLSSTGDVAVTAGESVAVYAIEEARTRMDGASVGSDAQMNRIGSGVQNETRTQVRSAVEAGGALAVTSGADLMVKGAVLRSGDGMTLDAGRNLAVVSEQDSSRTDSTSTMSGAGVGGGMHGTSSTQTMEEATRNVASSLQSGGALSASAGEALLVRGSSINARGDVQLAADQVRIEAGENVDRKTSRTETTAYLKLSGEGKTSAIADAKAAAASASETSTKKTTEVDGKQVASDTATSKRSASVSAEIETGKQLTPDPKRVAVDTDTPLSTSRQDRSAMVDDRGNRIVSAVDTVASSSDRQYDDGKRNRSASTSASSQEDSVITRAASGAAPGKDAAAGKAGTELAAKGSASASASAGASAEASGNAGVALVDNTVVFTQDAQSKAVASTITSGNSVTILGRKQVTLQGAKLDAAGDAIITGGKVDVLAAQDSSTTSSTTRTASAGFLIDSKNKAEAAASGKADAEGSGKLATSTPAGATLPDKVAAKVGGSAAASGEAKAAANSNSTIDIVRYAKTETTTAQVDNRGSDIRSGGNLRINAGDKLTVQGAALAGGGNVDLQAKDMEFAAVQDTRESTTTSSKTSGGLYADGGANAQAAGSVNAKGEVAASVGDHGALNQDSAHAGLSGSLAAKGKATADAKAGAGLQFRHETASETAASGTAVVTTIRSGGDITRTADKGILDVGTGIDAAGDFTQQAATVESKAASNTASTSSTTQSDAGKLGVYAKANAEASGNLNLSAGAGAGYTGNTLDKNKQSKTVVDANAGVGLEAEYAHKDATTSASSSTAVVSTVKAGGRLDSTSSGATTLEGTQLAGKNVALQAASLDITAAKNTTQSSAQETEGGGKISGGVNAGTGSPVTGGLSGNFDRTTKSANATDAVVGGIKAGDSVSVRTTDNARLEGTRVEAGGDARLDIGGKLDMSAATSTRTSSDEKIHGALELSATKSDSGSEKGMALEGAYAKKSTEESKSTVGAITAGRDLSLSTGGDARLEGAQVRGGRNTDVDVKGNLKIDAARDVSRSESISAEGSLNLGGASVQNKDKSAQTDVGMFALKAEGKYEKTADDKAVTASIGAGSDLRVRAGGDATLEGAELRAGNQASVSAGRDLNLKAATDKSDSTKFSGELSLGAMSTNKSTLDQDGKATPTDAADMRSAGLGLSGDIAKSESRRGNVVQAGAGGTQLAAGRDLAMEGGSVKSEGDVTVKAGGELSLATATSTASSIGGSLNAGRTTERNMVDTDKDTTMNKAGLSTRGGINEINEGTAINSGGQVRLASGGATSMTNTATNARAGTTVAAGKGVTSVTVKDRSEVLNLGASKRSDTGGTPVAAAPAKPWTAASPSTASDPALPAVTAKAQGPVIAATRKPASASKKEPGKPKLAHTRKPAQPKTSPAVPGK